MKIVKILGGLGNQMFQYALFLSLKERFPHEQVMIDTSCFRNYQMCIRDSSNTGYCLVCISG